MVLSDSSESATLQKKYRGKSRLQTKCGISKPIAERIAQFFFGDKFISITKNNDKMKFQVFVRDTVNNKSFSDFEKKWADVFELYKSGK